jgi:hypothetical protein
MTTIESPTVEAEPAIRRGVALTIGVSDRPDPVFGVVEDVYTDATGTLVAKILIPPRRVELRNVSALTPWVRSTPWWAEERPGVQS